MPIKPPFFCYSLGDLSGVARIPCALGQEIFLRPRQQKLQSLKRKISAKVGKKQKLNTFSSYFVLFRQ